MKPQSVGILTGIMLLLCVLHAFLVGSQRLLPLIDLPNHLAAATIFRHHGEADNHFAEYYTVEARLRPNTLHLFFCSLPMFPSVEVANRVFFAIYALLFPLAVWSTIKKLGGNTWFAVLSFIVIYNYNFHYGFVGFLFAVPLVVLAFRLQLECFSGRALWPRVALAALLVLIFFSHVLAVLFAVALLAVCAIAQYRRSPKALVFSLLPFTPVCLLVLAWWAGQSGPGMVGFLRSYYRSEYLPLLPHRLMLVSYDNYHLFSGLVGLAVAAAFFLVLAAPLLVRSLTQPRSLAAETQSLSRHDSIHALLFLVVALLCFFLLPDRIPMQWKLFQRFCVFCAIGLILVGSLLCSRQKTRWLPWVASIAALVHYGLFAVYFGSFQQENRGFTPELIGDAARDIRVGGIMFETDFRGRPVYLAYPSYDIVWRCGIATSSIVEYRFGVIRRNVDTDRLPAYYDLIDEGRKADGRYHDVELILTRGSAPPDGGYLTNHTEIKRAGAWALHVRSDLSPQQIGVETDSSL